MPNERSQIQKATRENNSTETESIPVVAMGWVKEEVWTKEVSLSGKGR